MDEEMKPAIPILPEHVEEVHTLIHRWAGQACTAGEGWCATRDTAYEIAALYGTDRRYLRL